jgi:succinate-semialdehyde dehydrogenase/glutarate-semialdehyde dehydrogenase
VSAVATASAEESVIGAVPKGLFFGPVAPVVRFSSEDEAIAAANATEYGLVSYVYSRDVDRALHVIDRLETGMVGLNRGLVSNSAAPFGGVKAPGFGRAREPGGIAVTEHGRLRTPRPPDAKRRRLRA